MQHHFKVKIILNNKFQKVYSIFQWIWQPVNAINDDLFKFIVDLECFFE